MYITINYVRKTYKENSLPFSYKIYIYRKYSYFSNTHPWGEAYIIWSLLQMN